MYILKRESLEVTNTLQVALWLGFKPTPSFVITALVDGFTCSILVNFVNIHITY